MNRTTLRWIIAILTIVTALIHLSLAFLLIRNPQNQSLGYLFIANGISYLVLLWIYLRPPAFLAGYANMVSYIFIAFVLVTIIGYFALNGMALFQPGHPIDLIAKIDEVLLVIALFLDRRQAALAPASKS